MHLVYLGIVSRPSELPKIPNSSVAGNKMQYNLLKYLSLKEDMSIDVISFQNSRRLVVKGSDCWLFGRNCRLWQVGYLNIPFIKQLLLPFLTFRKAVSLIREDDILMSFDIYPTQGAPLSWLKKRVDGRTACFLADLSIGGVGIEKGLRSLLRKVYDHNTLSNLRQCNNLIVLNDAVIHQYAPSANYIVIDGGIEPSDFNVQRLRWNGCVKNVVYTGALVGYSGIMNLIQAIEYLNNPFIVLDIYGDGPLKGEVCRAVTTSSRIHYHGVVNNEEAIKAQQTAWVLINPRPVENKIAKVTFPSKIFEYLMSGRPVITTRLNGFSRDYDQLLFWAGNGSPQELADVINKVDLIDDDSLKTMSSNARNYLLNNKTWKINADLVYTFLEGLYTN